MLLFLEGSQEPYVEVSHIPHPDDVDHSSLSQKEKLKLDGWPGTRRPQYYPPGYDSEISSSPRAENPTLRLKTAHSCDPEGGATSLHIDL